MENPAWNEYKGWARRARELQASSGRWSRIALLCICVSALSGACATTLGETGALGSVLSAIAAVLAATGAFVGRTIMSAGSEASQLLARATAEGLKSECYSYAAGLAPYDQPGALLNFQARRTALQQRGIDKGIAPLADDAGPDAGDPGMPPQSFDLDWYLAHRVNEQRTFYSLRAQQNESAMRTLGLVAIGAGLSAVVVGVLVKVSGYPLTQWITTVTTVSAAIIAYGLLDRRKYLAASYAAMAFSLGRLDELARSGTVSLPQLVRQTENLLQGEHGAWLDHTMRTMATPEADRGAEHG